MYVMYSYIRITRKVYQPSTGSGVQRDAPLSISFFSRDLSLSMDIGVPLVV